MSVFTSVYPAGHTDPDYSVPSNVTTNVSHATSERHQDAAEILDSLMKNRFSCRYFIPKPVDQSIIHQVIDGARYAPSGNNMQPWEKVYCITGEFKDKIVAEMVQAQTEHPGVYSPEYQYYPAGPIPPVYAKRRFEFGRLYYGPLHVEHDDLKGRARVAVRQYQFFGAPVALIFTINRALTKGSWLDVGLFLQSVALGLRARGLECITQESTANYQLILRKYLPISDDEMVVCAISLGYPDMDEIAKFSSKQPKREVSDIIEYFGW